MERSGGREAPDGAMDQMIDFSVGVREYGVDIRKVREVLRVGEITPLPHAPCFVKGVINLRGDVVPVIDLRQKLDLQVAQESSTERLVVVEIAEKLVGMVVDAVSRVVRVRADELEPAPPWLEGLTGDFVTGVVRHDEKLIVVLNVETILTSGEKIELQALEI
jgi:purine-binding chemotaxis protein CheW